MRCTELLAGITGERTALTAQNDEKFLFPKAPDTIIRATSVFAHNRSNYPTTTNERQIFTTPSGTAAPNDQPNKTEPPTVATTTTVVAQPAAMTEVAWPAGEATTMSEKETR